MAIYLKIAENEVQNGNKYKELAMAMLAGSQAIREKCYREGTSTYVFDHYLFNSQNLKIDYVDALNLLGETALDVLYEREEGRQSNGKVCV